MAVPLVTKYEFQFCFKFYFWYFISLLIHTAAIKFPQYFKKYNSFRSFIMKKILAVLVALGLTSFAFAADTNATGKSEKKAEKKAHKVKKEKKEANATK